MVLSDSIEIASPRNRGCIPRELPTPQPSIDDVRGICSGPNKRLLAEKTLFDVNEDTVKEYQNPRLREKTAPKIDQ